MSIRRRIKRKYFKLPYHKQYGPFSSPPLHMRMYWPNGSQVTTQLMLRRKNKETMLGWVCPRGELRHDMPYGVWVCTKVGALKDVNQLSDYEYVGEAEDHLDALDVLKAAYEEKHNTVLV